ncbi:hypothetical protein SALBM135S_09626 [Streptomyces alboniger]
MSVALTSGLSAVGSALERRQAHWERERCAEAVWEDAVAEVLTRNAQIEVTKAALTAYGGPTPLPEPLVLFRQQVQELRDWSVAADRALAAAESLLLLDAGRPAGGGLADDPAAGRRAACRAAPGPVTGPARERGETSRGRLPRTVSPPNARLPHGRCDA